MTTPSGRSDTAHPDGWDEAEQNDWNAGSAREPEVRVERVWNGRASRQGDYLTVVPDDEYRATGSKPGRLDSYTGNPHRNPKLGPGHGRRARAAG